MARSRFVAGIIALALLVALSAAASAQSIEGRTSSLVEEYERSLAQLTIDYWTPLLNQYRAEIDRMLSAPDLAELRELRTRAALLLERMTRQEERQIGSIMTPDQQRTYDSILEMASRDDSPMIATASDDDGLDEDGPHVDYDSLDQAPEKGITPDAGDTTAAIDVDAVMQEYESFMMEYIAIVKRMESDPDAANELGALAEKTETIVLKISSIAAKMTPEQTEKLAEMSQRVAAEMQGIVEQRDDNDEEYREELRILELVLGGDERVASLLDEVEPVDNTDYSAYGDYLAEAEESSPIWKERSEIQHVAEWIGRHYRSGLDELIARHDADVERYNEAIRLSTAEFYRKHREAVAEDRFIVRLMLARMGRISSPFGYDQHRQPAPMMFMYSSPLEAALLLYNGEDLRDPMLFESLLPVSNQGFENLPRPVTLGESGIDPASSRTVIPYTLTTPARKVVLEVVDSRGVVVASVDQGARESGEHSASIDATTLPAGDYLYELRVTDLIGERRYSKSMSVGR